VHVIVVKCQPCLCCATFSNVKLAFFGVCTFTDARSSPRSLSREPVEAGPGPKRAKHSYFSYFAEDRARIGRMWDMAN